MSKPGGGAVVVQLKVFDLNAVAGVEEIDRIACGGEVAVLEAKSKDRVADFARPETSKRPNSPGPGPPRSIHSSPPWRAISPFRMAVSAAPVGWRPEGSLR